MDEYNWDYEFYFNNLKTMKEKQLSLDGFPEEPKKARRIAEQFYTNYEHPQIRRKKDFPPSTAQLRPGLSIQQMVDRYTKTGELPATISSNVYFDDETVQIRDFDLSDIDQAKDEIVRDYRERNKPKAKAEASPSNSEPSATASQSEGTEVRSDQAK